MNDTLALRVGLPPRWMAYALQEAAAEQAVAAEVDAQVEREPDLGPIREVLVELLAAKSAEARADGAGLGALRWEEHPRFGMSIASVTGWLVDRAPGRRADEELDDILARLARQTLLDHFPPRVARVTLPYGEGVRMESARSDSRSRDTTVFQTIEYHVPLDDPPATTLFVSFTTSNLAYVDTLVDEFEAIVADIRIGPPESG